MNEIITVAIDGPAGAGKSTIAKRVAERLGAHYLNTGAMYRAAGLYMASHGEDVVPEVGVRFIDGEQHTYVYGVDVSATLHTPEGSAASSKYATRADVRARMVALQQQLARSESIVVDGRDICAVVLPDATAKIYLTASAEERANRRYKEMLAGGMEADLDGVLKDIVARDYADMHRAVSPLSIAEGAVVVDSTSMSIDEVVEAIVSIALENAQTEGRA